MITYSFSRALSAAFVLALTSCGVTRNVASDFKPVQARDIVCVRPVASMALIVRGDQAQPDQWFSTYIAGKIQRSLLQQAPALHLQTAAADDSLNRGSLLREVEKAAVLARQPLTPATELRLPVVESLVAGRPGRYALLLMCRGIVRTTDNYRQELERSRHQQMVFGLSRQPLPSKVGFYALVYDREQHRVVYFQHRKFNGEDLLQDHVLHRQLQRMLATDFGGYPSAGGDYSASQGNLAKPSQSR